MNHRLFQTIVVGSSVLMGAAGASGCMGIVAEGSGAPKKPEEPKAPETPGEAPSTEATSAVGRGAQPADAGIDVRDARSCEPGWPTTKGMVCTSDGGPELCCSRLGEAPVCCEPQLGSRP